MKQLRIRSRQTQFKYIAEDLEIMEQKYNQLIEKRTVFFQALPSEFKEQFKEEYERIAENNYKIITFHCKRLFEYGYADSVKIKSIKEYGLKTTDLSSLEKQLLKLLKKDEKLGQKAYNILVEMCEKREEKISTQFKNQLLFEKEQEYKILIKEYKELLQVQMHKDLDNLLENETTLNKLYNKQQYISGFKVGY